MRADSPDRRLPSYLVHVRRVLRRARVACLQVKLGRKLVLGRNVYFGKSAVMQPPQFARFGDNVIVGANFFLQANLNVGSDVLISSKVSIVGNDHRFDDPTKSIYWSGRLPEATICLEGDNLIGYGTIIVGDVNIGKGCVVGAGSVVTRDLPSNTVCAGVPAKPIRNRFLKGVS